MAKEIKYYGQLRPTGVDDSAARRLQAIAGLADQVQDVAYQAGARMAQREGEREGAIAGQKAAQDAESQRQAKEVADSLRDFNDVEGSGGQSTLTSSQAAAVAGQPLEKRAGILSAFSIKDNSYNDALESAYLSQVSVDSQEQMARIAAQYPDDVEGFGKAAAEVRKGITSSIDPNYQGVVGATLDNVIQSYETKVFANQAARGRALADESRLSNIETLGNNAASFARNGDAEQADLALLEIKTVLDSMVADRGESKEGAEERYRVIAREVAEQEIKHGLMNVLESEGETAAFERLSTLENPGEFTPDEFDAFKANAVSMLSMAEQVEEKAQAEKLANTKREIGRQVSDLQIAATNNLLPATEIIEKTNALFDKDLITVKQRTSIINSVIATNQTDINNAESVSKVSEVIAGDDSILLTQKDVDVYYEQSLADFDTSPVKTAKQAEFIGSTRLIPTRIKREAESALISGDIERMNDVVDLIDRVDAIPGMFDQLVNANQRAFASTFASLAEVLPGDEAVKQAMRMTDPLNRDRVERAKETINDKDFSDKYQSWTEAALGDMPNVNGARAVRQYKDLFETYFINGMSESDARTQTEKAMVANWGESEDFGFMQYRPEDFYAVNGETSYIKDQLVKEVRTNFAFPEPIARDDMFLVSNDVTARTASEGKPQYIVMVRTAAGELVTLQDRETGSVYWTPDQDAELNRQTREAKVAFDEAREVGEARKARQERGRQQLRSGFGPGSASSDQSTEDPTMYRADGSLKSARGYLGPVKNLVEGGTMTEVSIGVPVNGKEMEVPAMVPTLTQEEIDTLANMQIEGNAKNIPKSIKDKAIAHAKKRLAAGKSVFYVDGE
jgi:hypothetical protein